MVQEAREVLPRCKNYAIYDTCTMKKFTLSPLQAMPRSGFPFDNGVLGVIGLVAVVVASEVDDLGARRREGEVGINVKVAAVQSQIDLLREGDNLQRLGSVACYSHDDQEEAKGQ